MRDLTKHILDPQEAHPDLRLQLAACRGSVTPTPAALVPHSPSQVKAENRLLNVHPLSVPLQLSVPNYLNILSAFLSPFFPTTPQPESATKKTVNLSFICPFLPSSSPQLPSPLSLGFVISPDSVSGYCGTRWRQPPRPHQVLVAGPAFSTCALTTPLLQPTHGPHNTTSTSKPLGLVRAVLSIRKPIHLVSSASPSRLVTPNVSTKLKTDLKAKLTLILLSPPAATFSLFPPVTSKLWKPKDIFQCSCP